MAAKKSPVVIDDALLALGVAVAGVACYHGNRTAFVLLTLLGVSLAWNIADIAVNWQIMRAGDYVAIAAILANFRKSDTAIIALFPVAWLFYGLPLDIAYWGVWAAVVTQLFLCGLPYLPSLIEPWDRRAAWI